MWGGVRMGPMGGAGRVAAFLMALALLMSPLLILVWIARSLLQDSIVLYVVVLAAALYWLRVCETLLRAFWPAAHGGCRCVVIDANVPN